MITACVSAPEKPPTTVVKQEVRSAVVTDVLEGRWLIEAVNARSTTGLWLELGGEGSVVMTKRGDGGFDIRSPQPPTKAFLGCNNLHFTGWTRNGDTLRLSMDGSMRTERGCDTETVALDEQAFRILRESMTMEFQAPSSLRLINEVGTLSLKRAPAVR
jgi:heat shock protein HslJ